MWGSPAGASGSPQVGVGFSYVLFVTGLAIALFSPELLRVMVPPDFMPPKYLLPIIIASYLAREIGDFFRSLLLINKRTVLVGNIALGSAALNLVANGVLIPPYGTYGAAWATLLTWAAYMVVCWVVANREHRLPMPVWAYLRLGVLVTLVYMVAAETRDAAAGGAGNAGRDLDAGVRGGGVLGVPRVHRAPGRVGGPWRAGAFGAAVGGGEGGAGRGGLRVLAWGAFVRHGGIRAR